MDAINSLDPRDPELKARAEAVLARIIGRHGGQKPTLAHYRKVYDTQGLPWPGDDQIRQLYPVAP